MKFKVGHLNIRSLPAHFMEVKHLLLQKSFDILALSETWLSEDIDSHILKIPSYNLYRCDRQSRGGGKISGIC